MSKTEKITVTAILLWAKTKWKALLAFLVTFVASLVFYLNSKSQKKVLQKANESHKKENEANTRALKDLEKGMEKINQESIDNLEKAEKKADQSEKDLAKEKEEFVKKAKSSDDLAKKLAERIGARFDDSDN